MGKRVALLGIAVAAGVVACSPNHLPTGGSTDPRFSTGFPASSDCQGVLPEQLGSSLTVEVPAPESDANCDAAISDESGNLAAVAIRSYLVPDWYLFDSSGGYLNRIRAIDLSPQGPGYVGLGPDSAPADREFLRVAYWSPDGKETAGPGLTGEHSAARSFRAPNGVLVVTVFCAHPSSGGRLELHRFDSSAHERASTSIVVCERLASALVDARQNWLLLVQGGPSIGYAPSDLVAQWFDPAGKTLTGWFRVATLPGEHRYLMHALIGGGAALQIDGSWTYSFPSGTREVQAAPEFLATHPQTNFTLIRGAQAYALLPRSGDTTVMELFSASGNRCGSLKFPQGDLTTGADGSVIARGGPRGCTKTIWPRLLR